MTDDSIDIGEEFLEHYGVKGMHWGVRKQRLRKTKIVAAGVISAVLVSATFPVSAPIVFASGAVGAFTARAILDRDGQTQYKEIRHHV
jgi:hypothetical protein